MSCLAETLPFKCLVVLVFVGPDTRDTLTSLPAIRGSGNIARTVEGTHLADDKTEALMTENVARPKDTKALVALPNSKFCGVYKA